MAERKKNRREEEDLSFMENLISEMMIGGGDAMKFKAMMEMMSPGDPAEEGGDDSTAVSPTGSFENIMGRAPMQGGAQQGFQVTTPTDEPPPKSQSVGGFQGFRRRKNPPMGEVLHRRFDRFS
jgi:hypothetical protein